MGGSGRVIKCESAKNADNTPIWNIKLKETRWSPGSTGFDRGIFKKRAPQFAVKVATTRLASRLCQDKRPENRFIRTWPRRRKPFILQQQSKLWKNKQKCSAVPLFVSLRGCLCLCIRDNSLCRRQVVSSFYTDWFTSISIIRHVFIKWTTHPFVRHPPPPHDKIKTKWNANGVDCGRLVLWRDTDTTKKLMWWGANGWIFDPISLVLHRIFSD